MFGALLLSTLLAGRPYLGPEAVESPGVAAIDGVPIDVQEPRGRLGALVWAADSRSFWVVGGSRLYRVQADTGAVIGQLLVPDGDKVDALAISPDGAHLAATTLHDHVMIWRSATGKLVLRVTRAGWMLDGLVAFSPDGKRVFAALYSDTLVGEEVVQIEAWDAASGRSLGKKRVREVPLSADSPFEFQPLRLAGSHVFFDDLLLFVRDREVRPCDDELPYTIAGELGWYGDAGVRRVDDCKLVRADTSPLDRAGTADVHLTPRGERAAYLRRDGSNVTIAMVDLAANTEMGRLEYGDVGPRTGFGLAPDGSRVAATLIHRAPDGGQQQILLVWQPLAAGKARVLALRVPQG